MISTLFLNNRIHRSVRSEQPDDFGIAELLETLNSFCDADFDAAAMQLEEQELELLAAVLIQQLCAQIDGKQLASFLTLLRGNRAEIPSLVVKLMQHPLILPPTFPAQTSAPRFADGAAVRWLPLPDCDTTDSGIVIGRCFAYAPHQGQWGWQYLVWLKDTASPVLIDTAWEEDLEQLTEAVP